MKSFLKLYSFILCLLFLNVHSSWGQTGCDIAAIRAAFAAEGHYDELTGVTGQPCSMYFINTNSQDSDLSETQAQMLGAHMAVFNSAAENSAVVTAIYATYTGKIWIGYKRSGAGASTFYAMDGTTGDFTPGAATGTLYQNWNGGEPNNSGYGSCGIGDCSGSIFIPCADTYKCENGEQCTQVYSDGQWNDLSCNDQSISVVEVNLCPETTITPTSTSVCGGGSVTLATSTILGSAPFTYSWTSVPAGYTSTSETPVVSPTENTTYDVTATDRYGCTSQASVSIQVVPVTTTISSINHATCVGTCDGSATASATGGTGAAAFLYSWDSSPIQTTATATGLCAGTYICTVIKDDCEATGSELVSNFDFNAGNVGFTSSYSYVADGAGTSELNPEALYTVISGNASQVHGSFSGTGNGGSGGFMIINGSSTANTNVWCDNVTVVPNTDYVFSAWLSSVHTNSPAILQFSFNGVNTGSVFNAPSVLNQWDQFNQSWNSGVSTSVDICVVNQNTASGGNDFALDDISFKYCAPTCSDTAMVVITESGVTVDPITPSTICASGDATLTAVASGGNGTYTYAWSPAVTGTGASVTASPIVTTTYTVIVSDGNGCAAAPEEVTVTVNSVLTVTVNDASLCFAEVAILTASGAADYSWSPATDLDVTTGAIVISSPSADISYTVTGTSGGCVGTAVSTVTINPTPNSDAGADISICSGTSGSIGAPSTPGYVYSWAPASDLDDGTLANPTVTPTNFTAAPVVIEYIVTTSPAGCFSNDTVIVTVDPSNDPTFNYSGSTFCQSAGATNPNPTIVTLGGLFSSTSGGLNIDSNTGVVDLALSTLGTYTVTYSHSGACPSNSSATITITNIPDADFSFDAYCQNEPNPLPLFTAGSSAGLFSSSAGLTFIDASTGEIDLAASTTGTYTITNTITAGGGCPDAVGTNTITINPIPITLADDKTICIGNSASLVATGATSYLWSDGTASNTLTISPTVTTSYTVTGTTAGCSSDAIETVFVDPLPTITVEDVSTCSGSSITLTANGGTTYVWSDGTTGNTLTVSPLTPTSYTVTGTSSGCSSDGVGSVAITSGLTITVNSPSVCQGATATLTASGALTYAWSDGSTNNPLVTTITAPTTFTVVGTDASGCSGTITSSVSVTSGLTISVSSATNCPGAPATLTASGALSYVWSDGSIVNPLTVSPTSTTSYTVVGTDAGGCTGTASGTITTNPLPVIEVDADTICEGRIATLTASGGVSYVWSNGSISNTISVSPAVGTTSYTVTGTDANGCSLPVVGNVSVYRTPVADFTTSPNQVGILSPIVYFNNASSLDVNYWFWSFGDGDSLTRSSSPSHLYPGDTASYTATLIVHNAGFCYDTANHVILIGPEFSFYIPNAFTPDGDGINDMFFGKGEGIIEFELMVFDRWGNFIFHADDLEEGWDGKVTGGIDFTQQDVFVWKVNIVDLYDKVRRYTGTVTVLRGD